MDIDLLTSDINKFSYHFLASKDHYSKGGYIDDLKSEILYDDKPYKYCQIASDPYDVSKTWLCDCSLYLMYNDNINKEMVKMAINQYNGKNKTIEVYVYEDRIKLYEFNEQSIKKLIKCIDDIVNRW